MLHPPTPPPQVRPFERLALIAADLPKGCLALIPVVSGAILWGWIGTLLGLVSVIGGPWRVLALRGIRTAGAGGVITGLWLAAATAGSIAGLVSWLSRMTGSVGPIGEWAPTALDAWRALGLAELLLATIWVGAGAIERGSRWALVPLGLGALATLASTLAQGALATSADALQDKPLAMAVLGLVALAGGITGPVLVADGVARLLQSLSSESLDEESEPASPA